MIDGEAAPAMVTVLSHAEDAPLSPYTVISTKITV